jgi:hypothetical protein
MLICGRAAADAVIARPWLYLAQTVRVKEVPGLVVVGQRVHNVVRFIQACSKLSRADFTDLRIRVWRTPVADHCNRVGCEKL